AGCPALRADRVAGRVAGHLPGLRDPRDPHGRHDRRDPRGPRGPGRRDPAAPRGPPDPVVRPAPVVRHDLSHRPPPRPRPRPGRGGPAMRVSGAHTPPRRRRASPPAPSRTPGAGAIFPNPPGPLSMWAPRKSSPTPPPILRARPPP